MNQLFTYLFGCNCNKPEEDDDEDDVKTIGSTDTDNDNCSICLDELDKPKSQCILEKCGHIYHNQCIKTWTKKNNTCPLCRAEIT